MSKYTLESYIETAKEKWGDRFTYEDTKYSNSYHKISARCVKHDEVFTVDPISFIRKTHTGNFCSQCKSKNKKMTHDEFMEKIDKYSVMYDLSEVKFTTTRNKVILNCPLHGKFEKEARYLSCKGIRSHCPKCNEDNNKAPLKIIEQAEEAVFYKIIFEHLPSKLRFLKIGITSKTSDIRYKGSQYKDFTMEIIEEVFDTGKNVIEMEREYKKNNKDKRLYLPKNLKFGGRTECYIIDEELSIKANQVKIIRDGLLEKQEGICPLCENEVKFPTLDHFHSKRHNGDGKIRGVLCNNCNRLIGVIENKSLMNGISFSDLPNFLRKCADYAEKEHYHYIHPSEKPKEPKLSKRNYNKLKKLYNNEEFIPKRKNQKKKPMLPYPKSGKITKGLEVLYKRFEINPYN